MFAVMKKFMHVEQVRFVSVESVTVQLVILYQNLCWCSYLADFDGFEGDDFLEAVIFSPKLKHVNKGTRK